MLEALNASKASVARMVADRSVLLVQTGSIDCGRERASCFPSLRLAGAAHREGVRAGGFIECDEEEPGYERLSLAERGLIPGRSPSQTRWPGNTVTGA